MFLIKAGYYYRVDNPGSAWISQSAFENINIKFYPCQ